MIVRLHVVDPDEYDTHLLSLTCMSNFELVSKVHDLATNCSVLIFD